MRSSTPSPYQLLAATFLLAAAVAHADDNSGSAPPLATIDVPLHFDSAGRYAMNVSMSDGSGRQNFTFAFTTCTGLVFVGGCGGSLEQAGGEPLYNQTKSITAQVVSNDADADMFGVPTANTSIIKETCAVAGKGGALWSYQNQTIIVVKDAVQNVLEQATHVELGKEVSGILGLGTNRYPATGQAGVWNTTFEDSVIGQWFQAFPQYANFSFGMAVGDPIVVPQPDGGTTTTSNVSSGADMTATSDAGVIHLLQPDSTYYKTDQVSWVNANVSTGANNGSLPPSDWTVILDGWMASTKTNQLSSKGQIVADLDPLYTGIYVPQDQAALIHASIPGAQLQKGISTLGNMSMTYTIPCDAQFAFGIMVGSQTFMVDQSNLIIPMGNGRCASSIEAWTDSWQTQYAFGSRLLCTMYMIFSVPRNGTQQIGFAPRSNGSAKAPLDVKAIVGGTVGGAALLVFTILGGLYLRKYWKQTASTTAASIAPSISERDDLTKSPPGWPIHPFTMMAPTSELVAHQPPLKTPPVDTPSFPPPPLVPNRLVEGSSPSTASTTGHQTLSPLPTSVIFIDDNVSMNPAPPSYRGHDSYQPPILMPPSPSVQTARTGVSGTNFSTRATCGVPDSF